MGGFLAQPGQQAPGRVLQSLEFGGRPDAIRLARRVVQYHDPRRLSASAQKRGDQPRAHEGPRHQQREQRQRQAAQRDEQPLFEPYASPRLSLRDQQKTRRTPFDAAT